MGDEDWFLVAGWSFEYQRDAQNAIERERKLNEAKDRAIQDLEERVAQLEAGTELLREQVNLQAAKSSAKSMRNHHDFAIRLPVLVRAGFRPVAQKGLSIPMVANNRHLNRCQTSHRERNAIAIADSKPTLNCRTDCPGHTSITVFGSFGAPAIDVQDCSAGRTVSFLSFRTSTRGPVSLEIVRLTDLAGKTALEKKHLRLTCPFRSLILMLCSTSPTFLAHVGNQTSCSIVSDTLQCRCRRYAALIDFCRVRQGRCSRRF